ncbi:hypothetical protein EMGBD4_14340 [Verrucomicrobiota bacterium]|nr:hypothetical protein EMGBD4_14340 [Verrucomicrobiota bacterium]
MESVRRFLRNPEAWFASAEARQVAAIVLSFQCESGGWPKNTDTISKAYAGDRTKLMPTFDNKATVDELRFMARMFNATKEAKYRQSFDRGLAYVLSAQYPNGGWPQFFPLRQGYWDHITFNDDAMVRVLRLVREVATEPTYTFLEAPTREGLPQGLRPRRHLPPEVPDHRRRPADRLVCATRRGDLGPRQGPRLRTTLLQRCRVRGYRPATHEFGKPSAEVKAAIEGAVRWFEAHKVTGRRLSKETDQDGKSNLVMAADPKAPALWARFYDLRTGQPFVCDRDGVPKPNLADLGSERRNGYSWFGEYARDLVAKDYPAWKQSLR